MQRSEYRPTAVYSRELADPDLPEVPSVGDGNSGTARPPVWRKYGADQNRLLSWGGIEACLELRGGGLIEGPRDSGTQYAQRTGETVSGMKTTAGDSERGHKGRAACLHSFGGAA
ncbi:hypothetical protein DPMN_092066 [Dreissena polymorpha]|uniref:Uncharacterized protein n=1 Tax=Dreissena polymorpha TaxID=45954 RepID=A0A9D4L1J6_DREPO|nr:hypothetical protein DPMN_092066 [Dreissena polymorpha]